MGTRDGPRRSEGSARIEPLRSTASDTAESGGSDIAGLIRNKVPAISSMYVFGPPCFRWIPRDNTTTLPSWQHTPRGQGTAVETRYRIVAIGDSPFVCVFSDNHDSIALYNIQEMDV